MKGKLFTIILLGSLALFGVANGATCLFGTGGGTGLCSATTSNIGQSLVVSSSNPYVFKFASPAGAGGASGVGTSTVNYLTVYLTPTTVTGTPLAQLTAGTLTFSSTTVHNNINLTGNIIGNVSTSRLVGGTLTLGTTTPSTYAGDKFVSFVVPETGDSAFNTGLEYFKADSLGRVTIQWKDLRGGLDGVKAGIEISGGVFIRGVESIATDGGYNNDGQVSLTAGDKSITGSSNAVSLKGGDRFLIAGDGGPVVLQGGNGFAGEDGSIELRPGYGGGTNGTVRLFHSAVSPFYASFAMTTFDANHAFEMPNVDGTLSVRGDNLSLFTNDSGFVTASNGTVLSGLAGQFPYYSTDGVILAPTSTIFITPEGRIGINSTTPIDTLAVQGGLQVVGGITSTNAFFTNVSSTNATSTNLAGVTLNISASSTFSTTSITNGFFQTGFADCSSDTQTVNYTLSTGKFTCLTDSGGGAASSAFTTAVTVSNGSTTSTLTANSFFVATSSANLQGLFFVDSSGNVSASGTLRVFKNINLSTSSAIFFDGGFTTTSGNFIGDWAGELMVGKKVRPNQTTTPQISLTDPDIIPSITVALTQAIYSDDITRMLMFGTSTAASTMWLRSGSFAIAAQLYFGTTAQTITNVILGGIGSQIQGAITVDGFHYVFIATSTRDTVGVAGSVVKRATSSPNINLNLNASWPTSTWSGSPATSTARMIGAAHTGAGGELEIYFASSTTVLSVYSVTSGVLTFNRLITIAGANCTISACRVNDNGIYVEFAAAPFVRKYTHAGVAVGGILNPLIARPVNGPDIFVTARSFYGLAGGSVTALTRLIGY